MPQASTPLCSAAISVVPRRLRMRGQPERASPGIPAKPLAPAECPWATKGGNQGRDLEQVPLNG